MNSESRMTIVVPVLNREATLQRTLDSISSQTARPLSVIIVDNGSTDNSRDIASRWMSRHKATDFDITLLDMPEKGVSKARNLGLREAVTPYIMFFDSDDTMSPHHVEDIMTEFAADPTLDIVGRDVRLHKLTGLLAHFLLPTPTCCFSTYSTASCRLSVTPCRHHCCAKPEAGTKKQPCGPTTSSA